jgi:hypothetical protein
MNFSNASKKVRQQAQWELYKSYMVYACVVLVFMGILVAVICTALGDC